ncbi:MAG: hypothetical protein LC732_01015, partial [Acidobacteria bacterium]|nr:hypothetical protein [Acidobacteriota bacterium]
MRHRWLVLTLAVLVAAPAAAQLSARAAGEVPRSNALEVFPLAEPEISGLNLGWNAVIASDGSG